MSAGEATEAPLPPALYARPEAFQRERRSVFQNAWLLLARADAVRTPGNYVVQSLGGWPVFAIGNAEGEPGAFRNVCRHQGLPLLDTGAGRCAEIRCRYHGWTYDTGGRLVSAPPKVAPAEPADPLHHLERVTAQLWQSLLFVHLGVEPPPLSGALPVLVSALVHARFDTLSFHSETVTDIDANWKVVMEQALAAPPEGRTRVAEWPGVILDAAPDGVVLHQVISRSFQRSRVCHHHYAASSDGAALLRRSAAEFVTLKSACAAAQAALATGAPSDLPASRALAAFRARVLAAHAEAGDSGA